MCRGQSNILLALVLGMTCLFAASCTKISMVPETGWRDLDSNSAKQWEVTTGDVMYRVRRFDVTDSTIVLREVSEVLSYDANASPPGFKRKDIKLDLPMTLSFAEIKTIRAVEVSEGRTILLAVGVFGVGAIVTALVIAAITASITW